MKLPNVLVGLAIASAALGAPAAARADAAYDACIDASDGTNPAWSGCGQDWLDREDAHLNLAWKHLQSALDAAAQDGLPGNRRTRADLLDEQRAWVAYKESACRFYANGDFGRDGQVVHFFTCRAEVIAARTRQLEAIAAFLASR